MTMRFQFTAVRMAIIKNRNSNKCWQGSREKGTLLGSFDRNVNLVQSLWKAIWRSLKKLKIELSYDPLIPFLGIYLKECKPLYNRDTDTPIFIAALITIAKLWKQFDEWIKKIVVCMHNGVLFS
jgi:hypothetical protein